MKLRHKIENKRNKLTRKIYQLKVRTSGFQCASKAVGCAKNFDPVRERIMADPKTVYYRSPPNFKLGNKASKYRGAFVTKCWNLRNTAPCSPTLLWMPNLTTE